MHSKLGLDLLGLADLGQQSVMAPQDSLRENSLKSFKSVLFHYYLFIQMSYVCGEKISQLKILCFYLSVKQESTLNTLLQDPHHGLLWTE